MGRVALILLVALALLAAEAPRESPQPVEIRAERLEADYGEGLLQFFGRVTVRRGDFLMESREMKVRLRSESGTNRLEWAEALGDVRISYGNKRATCRRAVYYADEEKVILEGDPVLWEGDNRLRGARIVVFLKEDRAIVEGAPGRRVELVVTEEGGEGKFLPRP